MFVLANSWFLDLMRQFFYSIDKIIFDLIAVVYDLILNIARTSVLSQADILDMADRVYSLLTVFMIFKVTFSLIMYVVNPDDFSDKTKGIGKLGTNIVISLALLILTPYIFNQAYNIQTMILEDNALAALVFGDSYSNANENPLNSAGDKMAFIVMNPFFSPNLELSKLYRCTQLTEKKGDKVVFNQSCSGLSEDLETVISSENTMAGVINSIADVETKTEGFKQLRNYVDGVTRGDFNLMFRDEIALVKVNGNSDYLIDYKFLFSTAVAVVVVLLLINFCMDIALRSVKLAFLQLIAPIPIISYIDPKSGKDGLFKKWYKMCFSTYLSLFIRVLTIYFAIYIIDRLDSMVDVLNGEYISSLWVKIFVVIGVLMFAKQLPKILEGLGIKLDGDGKFTLNPLKKFEENAFGGKRMLGAAGGMAAGLIGGHGVLGRVGGMFGGATRGFIANKGYKGGLDRQADVNRKLREARINGAGFFGSRIAGLASRYGLDDAALEGRETELRKNKRNITLAERAISAKNKPLEEQKKLIKNRIEPTKSRISKKENVRKSIDDMESFAVKQIESNKAGDVSKKYRERKAIHQYLSENQGKKLNSRMEINGNTYEAGKIITPQMVAEADNAVGLWLNKTGKEEVMQSFLSGTYHDSTTQSLFNSKKETYDTAVGEYNAAETDATLRLATNLSSYSDIHNQGDKIDISVAELKNSISTDEAKIESLTQQIEDNATNQEVEIDGESVKIEKAKRIVQEREDKIKDIKAQNKLNRETDKNRSYGSS